MPPFLVTFQTNPVNELPCLAKLSQLILGPLTLLPLLPFPGTPSVLPSKFYFPFLNPKCIYSVKWSLNKRLQIYNTALNAWQLLSVSDMWRHIYNFVLKLNVGIFMARVRL